MTKQLGIIGYPLGHTLSPVFQQAALDACGIDARYVAWETPPDRLAERLRELRVPDVLGFNVTVPHKETVIPLLDTISDWAGDLGAVNTVVSRDGRLTGHNTDAEGFLRALKQEGDFNPRGATVLVLGAGGASRAVVLSLAREGAASVTIANRTLARAEALAAEVRARGGQSHAVQLDDAHLTEALRTPPGLIVNCTTLGMAHGPAEGQSPMPTRLIPKSALVYDLVYRPAVTPLLQAAHQAGARVLGGLPMLIYQGAAAFTLWTGREAPVQAMFTAARSALGLAA
ncbi:MAG: shikimate dehydrogenase [Dehalococcoidia bacterium]|nr:shikimate dehydrogenase [Dehalococcoidia bacterium]